MTTMRKIASLVLAMAMIFVLATTAFAQTIVITPPEKVDADATNTYKIYKVFDATVNGNNIAYTLVEGKDNAPAGFTVDEFGYVSYNDAGTDELTAADIDAIKGYVTDDDLVKTVTSTGTEDAIVEGLDAGYYYITTSTGSVVTIDSAKEGSVTVKDKNTVPVLDKKITGATSFDEDGKKALAQIGTEVEYTVSITVGKGATGYIFHDTMEDGLTFKGNDSVVVSDNVAGKYTILATPHEGDTLTITFVDGIAEGTVISITYYATINTNALTVDPEENTAYVSYGHNSEYKTTPVKTEVYNAKFTVTKNDAQNKPLAGAGFVVKNEAGKYYKIEGTVVSWVNSIDDATENFSGDDGVVPSFIGLANGKYTLVEKTVPAGYNKTEKDHEFEIIAHDYSADNLEQEATVVNRAGVELPSTGGMGTTLFYIVGGVLVAAAAVLLVTKKRMAN